MSLCRVCGFGKKWNEVVSFFFCSPHFTSLCHNSSFFLQFSFFHLTLCFVWRCDCLMVWWCDYSLTPSWLPWLCDGAIVPSLHPGFRDRFSSFPLLLVGLSLTLDWRILWICSSQESCEWRILWLCEYNMKLKLQIKCESNFHTVKFSFIVKFLGSC